MTTEVKTKNRRKRVATPDTGAINQRMEKLENAIQLIANTLGEIKTQQARPPSMPTAIHPEDRIATMRQVMQDTRVGGEPVSRMRSVDLRNPKNSGRLQAGDMVMLVESSPKYKAYCLDEQGHPVQRIYQYECDACAHTDPCPKGLAGAAKKTCPECRNTMFRKPTADFEAGRPAYGVIISYMRNTRQGVPKYKVHFEKFSERDRSEGMSESELVLCQ